MRITKTQIKELVREAWGRRDKYRYVAPAAKGVIYLPTGSAIALFEKEIKVQLSDGAWENSGPEDHWKSWSDLEVDVGPPRTLSNRHPKKQGYNLASLLPVIGDRMLRLGRMGKASSDPATWAAAEYMPATLEEFTRAKSAKSFNSDYLWIEKYMNAITPEIAQRYYSTSYDNKELVRDLQSIKQAMKNWHFYDIGGGGPLPESKKMLQRIVREVTGK